MKILKQIFPASLADESMSRRLYEIADQAGFPLVELLHLDAGINMDDKPLFVATLQDRPRVYFTSTILDNLTSEEISVAFAHELGHAKLNHVHRKLILKYLLVFAKWAVAAQLVYIFCSASGASGAGDAFTLLTLLYTIDAIAGALFPALEGVYSRYCEKQADLFALELTGDVESFVTGFERLYDVIPGVKARHALIGIYATHPGLDKRIRYARAWKPASGN
ncbi:MAG: M48 family metalloprotease [Cyanobacteriota/Melainabacteria group bacterium]